MLRAAALGFGRNALCSRSFVAPRSPGSPRSPEGRFGVFPAPVPTVVCLAPGLAEVRVGGCRADGAEVAAGGAAGDEVSRGPLPGQGTDGAARRVTVDKGEVQAVGAGSADGTLGAAGREPGVSPEGFMSGTTPRQATPHRLWHPQKLVSLTISKIINFLNSNK